MSKESEFKKVQLHVAAQVFAALHSRDDAPETAITRDVASAAERAIQAAKVFTEVWLNGEPTYD